MTMSDAEYQAARDEYRQAKAQLAQWVDRAEPAAEAAIDRVDRAAFHLAKLAAERDGRS
jgi:multidrug resistance efflux pump